MKKYLLNTLSILALSALTLTSCERTMSPDDPFPPEYKPSLYFSSDNRNLYSIDVVTRQTNWEFVADDAVKASPTIFKNSVILISAKGTIYKLNNISGALEQKLELNIPIVSTPVIYNDKLIVCTTDGRMIAYNGNDLLAEPFWSTSGLGSMTGSPNVNTIESLEITGVICANLTNEVFVIDEEDGSIVWRKTMTPAGGIFSSVSANGVTIYAASTNGRLYSIKTQNGGVNWSYATGGPLTASPVSIGGNVMVGSADMNFYSIDSMAGTVRWKVPAGDKVESTACYDNQFVYYGSNDQYIYCVDVIHGLLTWKKKTFSTVRSSPVVFENKVYAGSYDKNFYILNAEDGTEAAVLPLDGQMDCSPLIDNITRVYYPPVSGNYFLK